MKCPKGCFRGGKTAGPCFTGVFDDLQVELLAINNNNNGVGDGVDLGDIIVFALHALND
jgi:hypothetical protein